MKRTFVIALAVTLGLFVAGTAIAARNSSGTYSLPNAPVQSGQTITSTWANTTLADIKTEITDSLSRSGKGGMTAPLRTADGSSSFPAWSFTSETGSGFRRAGTSDVRFTMGAADIQTWTPTGVTITPSVTFSTTVSVGNTLAVASSGSFGGALNMASHQINNVTDPTAAQDAATKNYVDTGTAGVGGTGVVTCTSADSTPTLSASMVDSSTGPSVTLDVGYYEITLEGSSQASSGGGVASSWQLAFSGTVPTGQNRFVSTNVGGSIGNTTLTASQQMYSAVSTIPSAIFMTGYVRTTAGGTLKLQHQVNGGVISVIVQAGTCLRVRRVL